MPDFGAQHHRLGIFEEVPEPERGDLHEGHNRSNATTEAYFHEMLDDALGWFDLALELGHLAWHEVWLTGKADWRGDVVAAVGLNQQPPFGNVRLV